MKKSLLITTDYIPNTGGIANYWHNINNFMPKNNFFILAPRVDCSNDEENIIRKKFFVSFIWPHWLILLLNSYLIIKKYKIAIPIAGQVLPVGTVLYLLKKFRLIGQYYISCHGMDLLIPRGRKRLLVKKILIQADKIIVNSKFTQKAVEDYGIDTKKIFIVYPCPQRYPESDLDIKAKYGLSADNILFSVGRLVKRKGIDVVLNILSEVWKSIPDVVYIIGGDGPDSARLKELINKNIPASKQSQIIFTGRIPDNEMSAYFNSAKAFIQVARDENGDVEGFGMVYLEAGLYKLPVIAGKSGGVVEVVKDRKTGFLVNPEENEEIRQAIVKLLTSESLAKEYGRHNFDWASSFFWAKEAEKLIQELN